MENNFSLTQQLNKFTDSFQKAFAEDREDWAKICLLYTSPSPRDRTRSRMPSSA